MDSGANINEKLATGRILPLIAQLQGSRKVPEVVAVFGRQRRRSRSTSTRRRNGSRIARHVRENLVFFCYFVGWDWEKTESFVLFDKECLDEILVSGETVVALDSWHKVTDTHFVVSTSGGNGEFCPNRLPNPTIELSLSKN